MKALEEQLELAEAEAVEATAKVENELQAILKERETLIKERDSLSAKLRKLEREERDNRRPVGGARVAVAARARRT